MSAYNALAIRRPTAAMELRSRHELRWARKMNDTDELLDRLHDLLAGPVNEAAWQQVLAVFDPWPGLHAEAALDIALAHLDSWPERLRCCPQD